jgi:hypothetical protein
VILNKTVHNKIFDHITNFSSIIFQTRNLFFFNKKGQLLKIAWKFAVSGRPEAPDSKADNEIEITLWDYFSKQLFY